MSVVLTANNDGQTLPVDLAEVTGLDALVYRQSVGEELDHRIGALIATAAREDFTPDDWTLADRARLVWLWTRQTSDPDAPLALVAASVRLMYPTAPADSAGVVGAPEVP